MRLGVREGNHQLMVRVGDREQTFAEIPNRDGIPVWFQCVESPFNFAGFGFIEYPNSSDYVGGTVVFRGWALEDQGNAVAAVEIIIDGDYFGQAQYGYPRTDVADQYPHIFNSINSGWQFTMDTRMLPNARHRLTVRTVDSRGARTEIGSVDFYVNNGNAQP